MRTVSATDLRRRMGEILDRASAGERIVVERDRRPLAVLVPFEDAVRVADRPAEARHRARAALDRLETFAGRFANADDVSSTDAVRRDRSIGHGAEG